MAQAIPYIGYAIGAAFGTGSFLGVSYATWGFLAGSLLLSATQKGPNQQGPRLDDRSIIGTAYGQAIPWVAGSPRLAGQIIWASPLREIANTQKAGKGGGSKYTTFTYECDVMIMLTENVTEGVARDWVNAELVRNSAVLKGGVWESYAVYTGADDQMPDPTYESHVGVGNAPAYRGHTTIVIRSLQLFNGKQIPNLEHQASLAALLLGETSFLCQFDELASADSFVSEIGPDVTELVGGSTLSLDTGIRIFPPASGYGSMRSTVVSLSPEQIAEPWRWETWIYCRSTDFVTKVVRIENQTDIQYCEFEFGNSEFGTTFRFIAGTPTIGAQFVSVPESSFARPEPDQWYHCAFQQNAAGRLSFFFDGRFVAGINSSGTVFSADSTGMNFLGDKTETGAFNFDSTVLRTRLQPGGVWAEADYPIPSSPFTSQYLAPANPLAPILEPEELGSVLEKLLLRAGYAEGEFEVSGLSEILLHAYATGEVSGTRAHLETLRPFGKYEAHCTDKVYVFPRATEPAGEVLWEDLGAVEGADPGEPFALQQGNEGELPAQIALRYRNAHADYNVGTEVSDRLISSQQSTQTVEMGFGMTPAQAKSVVSSMLLDLMAGLGRVTLQVGGRKYAKFNPGDIITVTNPEGRTYRLRILTKRDSLVWLEWECVLDDASVLNPPDETYEGYVANTTPVAVAPTAWQTVAIPALRDADTQAPGPYVAVSPLRASPSDEWPGSVFVRARLPEAYEQEFISGDAAVLGATTSVLSNYEGGSFAIQRTGKVRVRVRGELSSSTWEDFFVDRTINACVIGNEPMRFMRAEFVSTDGVTNTYELSLFMRGQLGQEHEIVEHASGTRFVLLNNSTRRMLNETTDIGVEQQLKAVTLNMLLSSVVEEDFTESGIALRPYSVWSLKALAAGADLDVTWRRRSRLVARYTDAGTFTPLGEASEQYRVKVYADPDADPVRAVDVSTGSWAYLAADIASDGFTAGDPITITVQQLSDLVGEGFATTVETSAP